MMIDKEITILANYYLLDISYLLLACMNDTFSIYKIEDRYNISYNNVSLILEFWKDIV